MKTAYKYTGQGRGPSNHGKANRGKIILFSPWRKVKAVMPLGGGKGVGKKCPSTLIQESNVAKGI